MLNKHQQLCEIKKESLCCSTFQTSELDVCENKAIKFSRLIFRLKEPMFFVKFSQSTFIWKMVH